MVPPAYRCILLSRMRFIGDVVLTTPMIRSVRTAYPDAYIMYLGEKNAVSLLDHHPLLNEVIGYDFDRPSVIEQTRVALLLRKRKVDLAIDFFGNPRSALLMYLGGAAVRVGLDRRGRGRLFTIRVKDDGKTRTAIEFHNQFLLAAGIAPVTSKTEIVVTDRERREAGLLILQTCGERAGNRPSPVIGIHPGASWPAKRWLAGRFGELAHRLSGELGATVFATGGPADRELLREVHDAADGALAIMPEVTLRQLAALLALCDVYVSNDAGPMHIAAAVGTPTIGLFGPGEETIWFPYDAAAGHRALRMDVPCHPCHLDFCNRDGEGFMECMKLLSVNDVFTAVSSALKSQSLPTVR